MTKGISNLTELLRRTLNSKDIKKIRPKLVTILNGKSMPVKKENIQALIDESSKSKFYRFKLGDDDIKSEGVYILKLNPTQFSLIGDLSSIHSNLGESTGYFIKNGKYLVLEERDYSTIYVPIDIGNFWMSESDVNKELKLP